MRCNDVYIGFSFALGGEGGLTTPPSKGGGLDLSFPFIMAS